jgi:enamine deaminase RidA (YjgF/YER057c/UK114 family)
MKAVAYLQPDGAGQTLGLYSHLSLTPAGARLAFVAGQVGTDTNGHCVGDDFELQMRQTFKNVEVALAAVGADFAAVAKFTTYLTTPDNIGPFYDVRADLFPTLFPSESYPPNTLLVVQRLVRPELLIEVEAVAVAGDPQDGSGVTS